MFYLLQEKLNDKKLYKPIEEVVNNIQNSASTSFILKKYEGCKRKYIIPNTKLDYKKVNQKLLTYYTKYKVPEFLKNKINGFTAPAAISAVVVNTETIIEPIPEPPPVPDIAPEALNQINHLGESTFASLGLGGWTPVGIIQDSLEYLHVALGIPWWETIAIGTQSLSAKNKYQ